MADVSASFGRIGDGLYISKINVKGSGTTKGWGIDDSNDGGKVEFKTVSKLLSGKEIPYERTITVKSIFSIIYLNDLLQRSF